MNKRSKDILSERVRKIQPSATIRMNTLARDMISNGADVISFAAGEPDFPVPVHIKKAALKAINEGHTRYTPTSGTMMLKKAICRSLALEGLIYKPENILVTAGAKQSLYHIILATINPGDEVIIFSPAWVSFVEMVRLAGGAPIFLNNKEKKVTPRMLKELITSRTKGLIINSPTNPTGYVFGAKELRDIAHLCVSHGIIVISDETYDRLVYGIKNTSIASLDNDIFKQTFVIKSFSKTYSIPGWRIGFLAGNADAIAAAASIQDHTTTNPNTIAQQAAIAALAKPPVLGSVLREYKKRRDYMLRRLSEMGIHAPMPQGAFYIFADISPFFTATVSSSVAWSEKLLEKARVAVVPGKAFGDDTSIRLSFTLPMAEIKKGLDRLALFLQS